MILHHSVGTLPLLYGESACQINVQAAALLPERRTESDGIRTAAQEFTRVITEHDGIPNFPLSPG